MAANRALALAGRDAICAALGVDVPAPASMIGSMATIPLPGVTSDAAAAALAQRLYDEDGIEVPIIGWPVPAARSSVDAAPAHALLRISAQRYNELGRLRATSVALTGRADPTGDPAARGREPPRSTDT